MSDIIQILKESKSEKQLIMFPFAGGHGRSLSQISDNIKEDIEVIGINPPGSLFSKERRLNSIESLTDTYVQVLRPILKEKIIIFGHSMGGTIAYEFLNSLNSNEIKKISHIFLTGAHPPHSRMQDIDLNSNMSNDEIIKKCISIGGFPEQLKGEDEFCSIFCKMMKTDLEALENYKIQDKHKIMPIPATICWGKDEDLDLEEAKEWNRYFKIAELREFPGDHFFIADSNNRKKICKAIENSFKGKVII